MPPAPCRNDRAAPWPAVLSWLRRRAIRNDTAGELYGGVVARARAPVFYASMGIPDTPEGRYEMIAMHLVLVLERLRAEGPPGVALSRETIEAFVADMDGSMREMGVGDLTVPKKVKRAAAGLYARADAFRAAMAPEAEAGALAAAIGRLTLASGADDSRAGPLAAYYRETAAALSRLSPADVRAGRIDFPPLSQGDAGARR